ncbi:MAG: helix-turn-helix domain-containing protein [Opitutales bacterium]|nr:helix-turn-helix domain-containing protein [Opitutales bacterium]MCH8540238.1 helix-turn-helix domain-containing protein [Opitutales bacterium]
MPYAIREVLVRRIAASKVLHALCQDLQVVTGLAIRFYAEREQPGDIPPCYDQSAFCRRLNQTKKGQRGCHESLHILREETRKGEWDGECVAGCHVCAVPVNSSAGPLGFLASGGFMETEHHLVEMNHCRHLLERRGIRLAPGEIRALLEQSPVLSPEKRQSLLRLLQMAAGYLIKELSLELFVQGQDLPASIRRACEYIRHHFAEDPVLEEVAREVGLSPSHFSRLFHSKTGLRFKEYVNEVRLQKVRELLRDSDERITSLVEVAGFRSISQFNRQFRAHYGLSPRDYRKQCRERYSEREYDERGLSEGRTVSSYMVSPEDF